jgi:hypothetical protein
MGRRARSKDRVVGEIAREHRGKIARKRASYLIGRMVDGPLTTTTVL